jgi:hypothetical protein
MRLDYGTAEVRVEGWIPVRAFLDGWTDDVGADAVAELPHRVADLFAVDGHRLGQDAAVIVDVRRDAGARTAVGRGTTHVVPHHVRAELTLGGPAAKERVYAESVRAAFVDLVRGVTTGAAPQSGAREGWAAVVVADAARRSAADGRTIDVGPWPAATDRLVRTA